MPFTLAPHSEVEPSRPQEAQRASLVNTSNVSSTVTTTNHHPQRQRNACNLIMHTLRNNSMVRYGILIFIIALISILYFATTHQVLKPTGAGPTLTSELLTFNPKNVPNSVQKSPDDGFPTSIGGTQLYDTYEAYGKGNVQHKVEGILSNNTSQNLRGILYDRGDGCQNLKFNSKAPPPVGVIPSIPVPDVLSPFKIGLISYGSNSDCTLSTKINNSITDGDTAIIFILQNVMNDDEVSKLKPNDYNITIFTINKLSGNDLLDEINFLHTKYSENMQEPSITILTVTLSPYRQLIVSSWLFAMFAVGGILVASFFVSILIHMRLYRLRRNQQDEVRRQRAADEVLGMKKWTLEKEIIDTFPIVIYVKKSVTTLNNVESTTNDTTVKSSTNDSNLNEKIENDATNDSDLNEKLENDAQNEDDESTSTNKHLHRSRSTRSTCSTKSTRSLKAIENATNLYNSTTISSTPTTPTTSITPITPITPTTPISQIASVIPTTSTNSTAPTTAVTDDGEVDTCAICIEDFENGDELRLLPCKHWYHVECIDPWLTTKSSSCPLCKTDCRPNQLEEVVVDNTTNSPNQDNNNVSEENDSNNYNNNVIIRMSKAVGKLFGSISGRRSTSVRPANTQQPLNNNNNNVVELEMENVNSSS